MNKIICKIFGCSWRYNFKSIPNKRICHRCNRKERLNLRTLKWMNAFYFNDILGTDDEIKKRWFKNTN